MSEQRSSREDPAASELAGLFDLEQLREWLVSQRWYASKSRAVSAVELVEHAALSDQLLMVLAQARFATGTHELYQLLLFQATEVPGVEPIVRDGEHALYDVIAEPSRSLELLRQIDASADLRTASGAFSFRRTERPVSVSMRGPVRALGAEQSNSSIVIDERLILKLFRKLESGINPELEMLRFLTRARFPNIARLHGWFEYEGSALAATLGVAQEFVRDGRDGWELALEEIPTEPERLLDRLASLGEVTARMHNALASDPTDPAFSPEQPSNEALALLTATVDEDIERIFLRLPDDKRLESIAGRGEDVRDQLSARAQLGVGGHLIRIHGDYHLGQTLATPRGWVIIDFEGEPARPLPERRAKRSPLRDVAGMLRSFAYAASAVEIQRGQKAPPDFERRARARFLERYFSEIEPTLLPAGEGPIANLLAIFELEKAIYELRYELDNRPDWVGIPAAGIARLLEAA
jgi:maltokinase